MIPELRFLHPREQSLLLQTPALVTLLVAGADDKYNESEIAHALDLTKWKRIHARPDLQDFYAEVARQLPHQVDALREGLPKNAKERQAVLVAELEKVNSILDKLPQRIAAQVYNSLREHARDVAKSAGGVLGFLKIGYAESKVVDLPMLKDPRTAKTE